MKRSEIVYCENVQELLHACNLTVAQVRKNIEADEFLNEKFSIYLIKWFCKNVLLFNNFGNPVLR